MTKPLLTLSAVALLSLGPVALSDSPTQSQTTLTLDALLKRAMESNPDVASLRAEAESARAMIKSESWPDSPRLGFMRENDMNFMEQAMGPMNLWSVSQEVKFPTKYFLMGSAQESRASAASHEASAKRLEVRRKVISTYYGLFSTSRIISLLQAQRETLREVARSAESRHATGMVTQQDEMKAHVEQSNIETDLLMADEDRVNMLAMLNALLNQDAKIEVKLPDAELPTPHLTASPSEIEELAAEGSLAVRTAKSKLAEADTKRQLSNWAYAPDFMLSYKKAFTSAPSDNYAYAIEATIPIWFFMKEAPEVTSAKAMAVAAEKSLEMTSRDLSANIRDLLNKISSRERLLKIYDAALIPQASETLAASRGAYRAGKVSFLDLLDSERSLYSAEIARYKNLMQYIDVIAELEEKAASSLSSLPFGDDL